MNPGYLLLALLIWLHTAGAAAEVFRFDSPSQWQTWQMPSDLVHITDDGRLQLSKFRKAVNAIADADRFVHPTVKRGVVAGGIWEAKSNPGTADRLIDGDPSTYWQPDPADALDQWSVQIDLGRPVLARQIRLLFPDRDGARPLRQFSVFVSPGPRIEALDDVFKFEAVYRTPRPNRDTELTIPLEYLTTDSTYVLDESLALDLAYESRYQVVQYLIIEADEQHPDAALAEVEVLAVGDNVSLGTAARGGSFLEGGRTTGAAKMFDGDMDSFALLSSADGGWIEAGVWWRVDLGAVFFLDELFIYFSQLGEGLRSQVQGGNPSAAGGLFLVSDGRPASASGLPVPERVDYEVLVEDDCRPQCLGRIFHQRYLFAPRKVRYLLWHEIDGGPRGSGWGLETMLFATGHPAQVDMRSGFIDLAAAAGDGRPKVIKSLSWDAELPPATRIQLRSRSGNTLSEVYDFYDRAGNPTTEAKWRSAPKVLRGRVDTIVVVGPDWDAWSNVYQLSGEPFKSASPRRFVQLEMILGTDDPEVAPQVNGLNIEFEDALVQEARGRIWPREARLNQETRFTYTVWTRGGAQDSGFDLVRLVVPGPVGEGVGLRIGGQEAAPQKVELHGDSLFISLPRVVVGDSVEVDFEARIVENAALFALDLGATQRPGLWQSVVPDERRANIVLLPELPGREKLIADLHISTTVLTPNGDGINERLELGFTVLKIQEAALRVAIYDLAGRRLSLLSPLEKRSGRHRFEWGGRGLGGSLVPPGVYLCKVELNAQSGDERRLFAISVAY